MNGSVSVALDAALDELIALVNGSHSLDYLSVIVLATDGEEERRQKATEAAAVRGYRLDRVERLVYVEIFAQPEQNSSVSCGEVKGLPESVEQSEGKDVA